jgi:type II secretory pathway pseudopilin PulG
VELLAVIMIIAMLAALVTPAVMQALNSARNAAIKSEIDMLHMALMNYKSEYGVLPPTVDSPAGSAARHLKRLFPRCADPAGQLNSGLRTPNGNQVVLSPLTALTAWLGGYTPDPQSPLVGKRQKLYDFDQARVDSATGAYFPAGKRGSPYVYIPASQYVALQYAGNSNVGAHFIPPPPSPSALPADTRLWFTNLNFSPPQRQDFANPDTFQILCAGRDEIFGNEDDLSNFWPSTRGDYLESLRR